MWALIVAPLLALAFLMAGSGEADAFGAEVLGCEINGGTVTANSCSDLGYVGQHDIIGYTPLNLSGTYSYQWTVKNPNGATITASCATPTVPCIRLGCTATTSYCNVEVATGTTDKTYTATLVLTQSGRSRTISAQATVLGNF